MLEDTTGLAVIWLILGFLQMILLFGSIMHKLIEFGRSGKKTTLVKELPHAKEKINLNLGVTSLLSKI